jgi:hypothetical protein
VASLFGGDEPILVTRHGKISGLYLPLERSDHLPDDLGKELARVLGHHLDRLLTLRGVDEEEILEDFRAYRSSRR